MALRSVLPLFNAARLRACQPARASAMSMSTSTRPPVYVVFGATGGMGSSLAQRLTQQQGSSVLLVGRQQDKLDDLKQRLSQYGSVDTAIADVTDSKQVEAAIKQAVDAHGRISGVANCVGSIVLKSAHATSDADFDQVMRLNLYSCFNIMRPSVKSMMTTGGGALVFCSSAVARHGVPNHEAIAAAKAGVIGLTLSGAATYAPKNIRVNCVAPGLTRTQMASKITNSPGALKVSEAMHPLKRIGEPDEVAAAMEFLMNPSNSFITGQCLAVDGGLGSIKAQ